MASNFQTSILSLALQMAFQVWPWFRNSKARHWN